MFANRLVLDTNVCLDLFVFRDARWASLHAALAAGTVVAFTRADCRAEWLLVLHYKHLALDSRRIADCITEFDAMISAMPIPAESDKHAFAGLAPLPQCSDPHDQKFLEATRDSGAAMLITKDKALLKLANKCRRLGLFQILKPEAWIAT